MSVENSWLYTQDELNNSPSITQMMENLLEVENLLDLENSLLYTQDGLNNSPSITNPSWMMENLLEVENLLDDGYEVLGNILRETCEYEQKVHIFFDKHVNNGYLFIYNFIYSKRLFQNSNYR
jgi:hypothetical protein